jgi:dipeptidyl aminopeptidase/acylaminoacyl peptidase
VSSIEWSPDGRWIAFTSRVLRESLSIYSLPEKPPSAQWAEPARIFSELPMRLDGGGYLSPGTTHVFVVAGEGGQPRQITSGEGTDFSSPRWNMQSSAVLVLATRATSIFPPASSVMQIAIDGGQSRTLLEQGVTDTAIVPSPDGRYAAYIGGVTERSIATSERSGRAPAGLYLTSLETGAHRRLTPPADWIVQSAEWTHDGQGLYFVYADKGRTKAGYVSLGGALREGMFEGIGPATVAEAQNHAAAGIGTSIDGRVAFVLTTPHIPGDLALFEQGAVRRLTNLNDQLLGARALGTMEEFEYRSGGSTVQGWLIKPPNFSPAKKYPLILTIHGGPAAFYGPYFSPVFQLYGANGYVVLAINPRGSTSFGQRFADGIFESFPSVDYDDLMAGVDATLAANFIDANNLFVTGGSAGGTLTAWIVTHNSRFRAAADWKPIVNFTSWSLTSDLFGGFHLLGDEQYPWTNLQRYAEHSPLTHVGEVRTPTMIVVGEKDFRTPMSEALQFYTALKLLGRDTMLVELPGASHDILNRPSQLLSAVAANLAWFARYRQQAEQASIRN